MTLHSKTMTPKMNSIPATIRNGQVELSSPVNWPDGTPVSIVPLTKGDQIGGKLKSWPPNFFDQLRAKWGSEAFERPPQGEYEQREDW